MHNQKHSINRSPPRPVPVLGSPHRGRPAGCIVRTYR